MRNGIWMLLVLLVMAALLSGCSYTLGDLLAQQAKVQSFEETATMTSSTSEPQTAVSLCLLKDGTIIKQKKMSELGFTLIDMEAKSVYIYSAGNHTAISFGRPVYPLNRMLTALKDLPSNTRLQAETVDGVKCWVYEGMLPFGYRNFHQRVYFDAHNGLPQKIESDGWTVIYKYAKLNALKESDFALPPGTKVVGPDEMLHKAKSGKR